MKKLILRKLEKRKSRSKILSNFAQLIYERSLRRGSLNTGMGFVVLIMMTVTALGAMMVGSVYPIMKNEGNQKVIIVTKPPEAPKGNLQLYTFNAITLTPSPTAFILYQPQETGGFNYGSPPSDGGSSAPRGGGGGGGGGGSAI